MKKKRNSVFLRFLISYILILAMPLLTGSVLYQHTLQLLKNEVVKSNMILLEETKEIVDQRLDEINKMAMQLALNTNVKNLVYSSDPIKDSEIYKILDVEQEMLPYALTNTFISDFYIYVKSSNILVSPSTAYSRLPQQYDYFFKYAQMTYDEWHSQILNKRWTRELFPSATTENYNGTKNIVLYAQSLPMEGLQDFSGNILVTIDEMEICKLLDRLNDEGNSLVYIVDSNGQIIIHPDNSATELNPLEIDLSAKNGISEQYINGNKMTVTHTLSEKNGWFYVVVMPSVLFLERVEYIKTITGAVVAAILLIGFAAAFFFSRRNSRPIREIINVLSKPFQFENKHSLNEYDYIKSTITQLLESNTSLEKAVQEQTPLLQVTFFERLLKGEFNDCREIELAAAQSGLTSIPGRYIVVILRINGYNGLRTSDVLHELNTARVILKEYFDKILQNNGYIHNIDQEKIALLLSFPNENRNNYIRWIECLTENASHNLASDYNIHVSFAAGNLYDNLSDVYKSCNEAREALSYIDNESVDRLIWFSSLAQNKRIYYYPINLESKLINLVKAGDSRGSIEILDSLYSENFLIRRLSVSNAERLFGEITASLMKVLFTFDNENQEDFHSLYDEIESLNFSMAFNQTYQQIIAIYENVCEIINEKKKSHNDSMKEKIIQYVYTAYTDSELCLYKVAKQFGLTEVYLSHFFREQTGESFSNFIEKLRIENACNLLKSTDQDINLIATEIGYNSSTVFRRAFKKIVGVSPSMFRTGNLTENPWNTYS